MSHWDVLIDILLANLPLVIGVALGILIRRM